MTDNTCAKARTQHFTLFSKLPKEIRLLIWEHASEPRIVEVRQRDSRDLVAPYTQKERVPGDNMNPFYSPAPIPTVLHTNQESREFGLTLYVLSFPIGDHAPRIYFNNTIDILFFPSWTFCSNLWKWELFISQDWKTPIRTIAIEHCGWLERWPRGMFDYSLALKDYPNLEEVFFVLRRADGSTKIYPHRDIEDLELEMGEVEFYEHDMDEPDHLPECRHNGYMLWRIFQCPEGMDDGYDSDVDDDPSTTLQAHTRYVEMSWEKLVRQMLEDDLDWKWPDLKIVGIKRNGVVMTGGFNYRYW